MGLHDFTPQLAFQPPSDMGTNSGGGGNKIWKFLGIGCGLFLLISGLMLAFGSYKMASFCSGGIDMVKNAVEAQKYATTFANDISKEDFDSAYGKMTPTFQGQVSKTDFINKISTFKGRISESAVSQGFNATQNASGQERYKASYFFPSQTNEVVKIDFVVIKGEGEGFVFLVDTFDIYESERNMGREEPSQMVMRFHDQIAKGQDSIAYLSMGDDFRTKTSQEAFDRFLKDAGPSFTSGRVEVQSVNYHSTNSATVIAISRTRSGESMAIQYELAKTERIGIPIWQIEAIAPLVGGEVAKDAKIVEDAKKGDLPKIEIPKTDIPKPKTDMPKKAPKADQPKSDKK